MFYTLIQISDSHIRSLSYESAFDVRFEISFDLKLLFEFITTFTTFVKTLKICYSTDALKSPYFFTHRVLSNASLLCFVQILKYFYIMNGFKKKETFHLKKFKICH
jgi:hypothetical protein